MSTIPLLLLALLGSVCSREVTRERRHEHFDLRQHPELHDGRNPPIGGAWLQKNQLRGALKHVGSESFAGQIARLVGVAHGSSTHVAFAPDKDEIADEEEVPTWFDIITRIAQISAWVFLGVMLLCVAIFCYSCGGAEDMVLCCGVFWSLSRKTKMYVLVFLLLQISSFMALWQVAFFRPLLCMVLLCGIFGCFTCTCVFMVFMELVRGVKDMGHQAVEFLGYMDDKVDDLLDYWGLSDCSSEDDPDTTCWGTKTRKAENLKKKKAKKKAKDRPLVGVRQSQMRKPRNGQLKAAR
mmetsp:Transcript_143741/g.261492  ORF Transcript_143741/g.261492 Transcript_143741/m.261492 type:complete len:295 (+) Transcript_143741:76-960(+)